MEPRISLNWSWIVIAVLVGVGFLGAFAVAAMPSAGYPWMMGGGAWAGQALMIVAVGLLLVILGLALVESIGRLVTPLPSRSALNVVEERYATGELSRDDYLSIRNDILRRPLQR